MSFPLIVTAAIILEDIAKPPAENRILLTRNNDSAYHPLVWGLPAGIGGFRKTSTNNPDEAVVHEVMGDIGCVFEGNIFTISRYFKPPGKPPALTLFYLGQIIEGKPHRVCRNVLEVDYFPLEAATTMELRYNHTNAVRTALAHYHNLHG